MIKNKNLKVTDREKSAFRDVAMFHGFYLFIYLSGKVRGILQDSSCFIDRCMHGQQGRWNFLAKRFVENLPILQSIDISTSTF